MLSSISPVGERSRGQRWGLTATAYLLGSLAGGAAVGAVAGGLGALLPALSTRAALAALGAMALAGVLADRTTGVPTLHRQVDERWLTSYRGWVYGAGFGAQLGTGLVTIVPSSVVYAMWAGAVLVGAAGGSVGGSVVGGALVGLVFGAVRATPLLLAGRIRTVGALRRALAAMDRVRPRIARLTPVGQAAVGVLALGFALAA